MAINEFVSDVRTAARLGTPVVSVDSQKLDARRIKSLLESADLWLTTRAVSGFDEADFSFLPENERAALTEAVHVFRDAAAETPPDGPAPKPVRDRAAAALPNSYRCRRMAGWTMARCISWQRIPSPSRFRCECRSRSCWPMC